MEEASGEVHGQTWDARIQKQDGEFMLIFTNQQRHIEDGILNFPKAMNLEVKTRLSNVDLREVRIAPMGMGYNVDIAYMKDIEDLNKDKHQRIMGIDIGVRNILTVGGSIPSGGIVVRGGVLKSINQFFNREYARMESISDRHKGDRSLTKKEKKLFMEGNRKVRDVMHKLSRAMMNCALSKNIDTTVIGHNNGWKQYTDMGRRNSQSFVQLQFSMLIAQIGYKAEGIGMNVIIQEEGHKGKCPFLDNENMGHHDTYMGGRIKRGIFRSADVTLIHADLNAAYNVIRKAAPEALADGIEGIGLYPRSLGIIQMLTSKGGC